MLDAGESLWPPSVLFLISAVDAFTLNCDA
jgi:hypothetical protein